MPIRINLLAEALAEEDMRRRDPVKRAIYVGALLVALSLVWYSSSWLKHMVANNELNQVKGEIQSLTKSFDNVQANQKKIADAQKRLDALQLLSEKRFLQGTLLNALQQTYVPSVALIRLRVDQSYSKKDAGTAKNSGPGNAIEHIVMTLDAKDTSPNPGDQINKYKDVLSRMEYFKANLNPTNGVRLAGPPQQAVADGKPFVQFTLDCRFTDKMQ
jgi:hypothetical protein